MEISGYAVWKGKLLYLELQQYGHDFACMELRALGHHNEAIGARGAGRVA
jgi:hypothetical protein